MQKKQLTRAFGMVSGMALLGVIGAGVVLVPRESENPSAAESERTSAAAAQAASTTPANAHRQQTNATRNFDAPTASETTSSQTSEPTQPEPPPISPRVGRSLSEIIQLLNADNFVEARAKLDELMQADLMAQMTPFERARLYQLSFNLNMNDQAYEAAQADIQAALESGGLNEQEMSQMSYQRGQVFMQMEDYPKAADTLELWIAQEPEPRKSAYYLLAAAYYYQDKFDDARDHMETLMSMPGEKQEAWYSMMAALYLQAEDYAKAKPVVEQMVQLFGDDVYRNQLAGINAQLGESP